MYSRGRKREHSKVCIRQVTLSAGNPITAGFIGCRVPNFSSLSCIEISHFPNAVRDGAIKLNKQTYRSGRNEIDSKSIWQQCHVGSNPTVCAKYHYSILHWVVIFVASLQNSVAFLINTSPLFSSSDFRVRYKSYQQSRQIAIHRTTQDSSRSLGTN